MESLKTYPLLSRMKALLLLLLLLLLVLLHLLELLLHSPLNFLLYLHLGRRATARRRQNVF